MTMMMTPDNTRLRLLTKNQKVATNMKMTMTPDVIEKKMKAS